MAVKESRFLKSILSVLLFFVIRGSAPAQEADLTTYLQQQAKELDPRSASFNGLSSLDTLLRNKRIVLLGESSHGTEEYSQTKFGLIRYLHEKLGFNVVLFESPMSGCAYVNMATDTNGATLVRNSIQNFWHTQIVAGLFRYIKRSKMAFDGFDPQFMQSPYPALFYASALEQWPGLKDTLLQLDQRAATTVHHPSVYLSLKDSFSMAYQGITKRLQGLQMNPAQQWLQQMMAINGDYYAHINEGDNRDECMAKNIIWLAEHRYPHEKIIVWAHNTHIDKNATVPKRIMGRLLSAHFKDNLFAVGLFMANGTTALNNRQIIPVKAAMPGSLEALLSATSFRTTFITTNHPGFNRKLSAWHWGKDKQRLHVSRSFDAVVLLYGVNAPVYLNR
jgi:erythromycin esterase